MVFLTLLRCARIKHRNPDPFWKTRRVLRLTAHLYGRRRNCYTIAVRALLHVLEDTRIGRQLKKHDFRELWDLRIQSAGAEHGINGKLMMELLQRSNIFLNRKVLADLAIWEPRTFKALTDVAKRRGLDDNIPSVEEHHDSVHHFISKGLLRSE